MFVYKCNQPELLHIRRLTVHLFVSGTAPWWLLLSPSRGGEDEAMRDTQTGNCDVWMSLIPQLISVFGQQDVVKKRAPQRFDFIQDEAPGVFTQFNQTCPPSDREGKTKEKMS